METLPLRIERHCHNTEAVADHLKKHPSVPQTYLAMLHFALGIITWRNFPLPG